jgi:hypothetical protein
MRYAVIQLPSEALISLVARDSCSKENNKEARNGFVA